MLRTTIIRAFDGSLADAEGLLAVEKATFDESPYTAEEVQIMLTHGPQRAWLAFSQTEVVGFVTAFATAGLRGPCWEIDLLAVHPDWTGQGLATRLIRAAAAYSLAPASLSRAVVATNNAGSVRAFMRAGFRRAGRCKLLIFRPKEQSPQALVALNVTVREVESEELASLLPAEMAPLDDDSPATLPRQQSTQESTLLWAEGRGQPFGYAELLEVQTLLYRGIWIESLAASKQIAHAALVHEAVKRAIAADLDEIGMMVPERDQAVQATLRAAGFHSLGSFDWFTAALPLPGLVSGSEEL
jgi:ribosomal protein S18 acetylase RimI-like enzyme